MSAEFTEEWEFEGTVSHGTLNPDHLIPAFRALLDKVDPDVAAATPSVADRYDWLEVLDYLTEALESAAPEGYYFGTLEGDASDFGYWRVSS